MNNVYDILKERGYIAQVTHEDELKKLLNEDQLTFYIGFDATADSLTLGHFLTIMAMMHMEHAGHTPIALLGGGTTLIGDPSGRNDMRQLMTEETIDYNAERFKEQMSSFLDIEGGKSLVKNNKDWLLDINFLEFMREVGVHFNVNHMLAQDSYKNRLNDGLTFFEMSYLLLQSYDFLVLNEEVGCTLQMGGSDQWTNIIGGVDLIRKKKKTPAYGLTFNLLETADGEKMGKTAKGAVWLDEEKTSPYEMFQYLRNVDDRDVKKFLKLLTFLPLEEIDDITDVEGSEINKAKERLAFEVVQIVHGEDKAKDAMSTARSLFSGDQKDSNIPTTTMDREDFEEGIGLLNLLTAAGLTESNSQARNIVQSGGIYINDEQVQNFRHIVTLDDFEDDKLLLRRGRRNYHQIKLG